MLHFLVNSVCELKCQHCFFWRDLDFKWFPEANIQSGNGTGFFSVADFIKGQTMPGSEILNIRQWRARQRRRQPCC